MRPNNVRVARLPQRWLAWCDWVGQRPLALLTLFVAVSLLTRWLSLVVDVIDMDETAHIVGAWDAARGWVPYRDTVDNKPPLVYAYHLLAQGIFGRGLIPVHAFTALVTVPLTALGVSAFVGHRRLGTVAGLTFLVYSAAFIGHDMLASNTEIQMMLPATWALVAVKDQERALRPQRAFLSGVLVGVAFLFKYQVAAWLPLIGLAIAWAAWRDHRWRSVVTVPTALAVGFALPLLATWLTFRALDADTHLVYWTLTNNVRYAANPISGREAMERGLSYFVPFLLATAPLWWGTARSLRTWGDPYRPLLLVGVLVATVPAVALGFRFFPHYFVQFYAPLAAAAAPWLLRVLSAPPTRTSRLVLGWSALMLFGFMLANAYVYLADTRVYRERDPVFRAVAARLQGDACAAGATMFVWGYAPVLYYHADIPAASRFIVLAQSGLTTVHLRQSGQRAWRHARPERRGPDALGLADGGPRGAPGHLHHRHGAGRHLPLEQVPSRAVSPPRLVRARLVRPRGRNRQGAHLSSQGLRADERGQLTSR